MSAPKKPSRMAQAMSWHKTIVGILGVIAGFLVANGPQILQLVNALSCGTPEP